MALRKRLTALLLMAAAAASPATAAPPAPAMSFTFVRDSVECEPDCPEWIAAQGQITAGTARLFQAFLARLGGRRLPLVINSGGGSVEDAMEMGRLIRARRLAVAVGRTMFFTPPPAYDLLAAAEPEFKRGYASTYPAVCASACTLILAAGVERYASALALVGVHEVEQRQTRVFIMRRYLVHYRIIGGRKVEVSREVVSEDKNAVTSTEVDPAAIDARIVAYLREMGEDRKLLDLMRTASPDQIHAMTPDEEKDTRLVTIRFDQPPAMLTKPPDNGLDGSPLDPTSSARATLETEQNWPLEPSEDGDERRFAAHFTLRRGGAGVAATFSLLTLSRSRIRFGVEPGAIDVRKLPTPDWRTVTVFLPDAAFCHLAAVGDLYVARTGAPPTQSPGLPDPRAPLLRTPLSGVAGLTPLVEEACGSPGGAPAQALRGAGRHAARTASGLKKS